MAMSSAVGVQSEALSSKHALQHWLCRTHLDAYSWDSKPYMCVGLKRAHTQSLLEST